MSLQNQTYANSGNAYYVQNQTPYRPDDTVALAQPVEIVNISTNNQAYFGRILQNDQLGMAILEVSTNQAVGTLMGVSLNPVGTRGRAVTPEPQIYSGFSSSLPNLLMRSNETEVLGPLVVGTKLNQGDVNALNIEYTNTAYPTTTILQTSNGPVSNELRLLLQAPISGDTSLSVLNSVSQPTQSSVITNKSVVVRDTSGLGPLASLSFVGGQGAVTARSVGKNTQMLTNSGGSGQVSTDQDLYLITNVTGSPGPKNVLVGNPDGTTNIPLKMYGPEVSTIVATTSTMKSNYSATAKDTITNKNGSSIGDYASGYNNYQGQLVYNTMRNNYANPDPAPATAIESLEIINVSGGPQTGGIQFYTSNNGAPGNPKWMGGFLENNVGPTSEFRLASTVQASLTQITNLSTINNIPLRDLGVPTGCMMMWTPYVPTPPPGYLICDGGLYSQSSYSTLYTVIGETYSNGNPISGYFRVPNMCGKAAYGSVVANDNPAPGGVRINVTVSATITVNLPTGGTRLALYCTATDGALYKGMICEGTGYIMRILAILWDQTTTNDFVLLPDPSYTIGLGGGAGNAQFFYNDSNFARDGPSITNNQYPLYSNPGSGKTYYGMRTDEVAPHTHQQFQGGSQASFGSSTRTGDPNIGGPNVGTNQGIYSYTPPGGSSQSAVAGIRHIPSNTATWFIIKY